jgi:organic radical activating enzyme
LPAIECRIETDRGTAKFRSVANPVSVDDVVAAAESLEFERHRFVSFTGGEPLLQAAALGPLASRLRDRGPRLHLETHGLCVEGLAQALAWVDVVSMDWKFASDVRRASQPRNSPSRSFHEEHTAFLELARRAPEVVVKIVVTRSTQDAEIDAMTDAVARIDPSVPVVVQPVTPFGSVRETPTASALLAWVARIERRLENVRLIPQTHKAIGAL